MFWIVTIVLALLTGIILLKSNILFHKETREQFLHALEKFLEGTLRPIDGQPGGMQIDFFLKDSRLFTKMSLTAGLRKRRAKAT